MALPYLEHRGLKFAFFNTSEQELYGAFANTTKLGQYPIFQDVTLGGHVNKFKWPSAEHAFHAQKIIFLKEQLPPEHQAHTLLSEILADIENIKSDVFLTENHYDSLITQKYIDRLSEQFEIPIFTTEQFKIDFDRHCGADYHPIYRPLGGHEISNFMRVVVQLKLQQHPELANRVIECAQEGILPVLVSEMDMVLGTGSDGSGRNILGILLLEEGNRLLRLNNCEPGINDPQDAYNWLQQHYNLSSVALAGKLNPKTWGAPAFNGETPQSPQHQKPQFKYSTDGTNHYFLDKNTGITFVGVEDGNYYFTKNNQKVFIDEDYEQLILDEIKRIEQQQQAQTKPKSEPMSQPPHLKYKGVKGNDYHFLDTNTGITLIEEPTGVLFSEYGIEVEVPEDYKSAMMDNVSEMKQTLNLYYHHSNYQTKGRFHFFTVAIGKHEELNKKHQALTGDALKTSLLLEFKYQLEQCENSDELNEKYDEIINSVGYKNVLAKGQGVMTRLFDLKTSSVKALSKIKEELLSEFNEESISFGSSNR